MIIDFFFFFFFDVNNKKKVRKTYRIKNVKNKVSTSLFLFLSLLPILSIFIHHRIKNFFFVPLNLQQFNDENEYIEYENDIGKKRRKSSINVILSGV
mgnify:CR=1 FL=1